MKKGILIFGAVVIVLIAMRAHSKILGQQKETLQAQAKMEQRLVSLEKENKNLTAELKKIKSAIHFDELTEDFSRAYGIDIAHSPILGRKDAPITIVEFVDLQCPYCSRFHPIVLDAQKAFPDKVNVVLKNFPLPFHSQAIPAAKAAFAAGEQGKYWEMVDALLKNSQNLSEKKYRELAGKLGLNVRQFLQDYKEKDLQWQEYIQKDVALGNKSAVRGTPTIYINGRKTQARDLEGFKDEIKGYLHS